MVRTRKERAQTSFCFHVSTSCWFDDSSSAFDGGQATVPSTMPRRLFCSSSKLILNFQKGELAPSNLTIWLTSFDLSVTFLFFLIFSLVSFFAGFCIPGP